MSPKQWLALLLFYISYLFFGASIFYHSEQRLETIRRAEALAERIEVNSLLVQYTAPEDEKLQNEILDKVSEYCGKPVTNHTLDEYVKPYIWNFFHSFHFSLIVCSTVGYGNISPNNTFGRIFMIFYALIGIPVSGILFSYLGDIFSKTYIKMHQHYKEYKLSTNANYVPKQFGFIAQIAFYLAPGIIIFIFLPAVLFSIFEDWDYSISVYYAFVTLTTIGFGDFVPTFQSHQEREFGLYFLFYEIFIIVWVIFGLGYLLMITGFIARGMRSKKMIRLEHQLAINLKQTQSKIWTGVTKDVGYLRRILNEINLLKYKPVYNDPWNNLSFDYPRSESCPDLTIYRSETPLFPRRRTYSVCSTRKEDICSVDLTRTYSDTILNRIDRNKTFAAVNDSIQPADLLSSVITALGSFRDEEDDGQSVLEMARSNSQIRGIDLFSDSEILASERTWSGPDGNFHPLRRERATSESLFPIDSGIFGHNEWTWGGSTTKSNEIIQMRQRAQPKKRNELYHRAISSKSNQSVTVNIPDFTETPTNYGLLHKLNPFKKRNSLTDQEYDPQKYLEATSRGRESRISLPKQYISSTKHGRPSIYSLSPHREEQEADVLETTTIADLIRCLEIVHTKANNSPQRKLGTASIKNNDSLRPPSYMGRRSSLRPELFNPNRRQSAIVTSTLSPILSPRRFSIRPEQPPPYSSTTDSPLPFKRRFSVRPSSLAIPPGQAPPTSTSMLQRKLSIRKPSLLKKSQNELSIPARGQRQRPNSIINSRTRHGSLSSLYERNTESFTGNKD